MRFNKWGTIVENCWVEIPFHFPYTELDTYVIMPNHVHGIICVNTVGARHAVPLQHDAVPLQRDAKHVQSEMFGKPVPGSIPTIVRSFKSSVTKHINELRNTPATTIWQRNYYERVIRNEQELHEIRQYIINNPLKWDLDPENISNHNKTISPEDTFWINEAEQRNSTFLKKKAITHKKIWRD